MDTVDQRTAEALNSMLEQVRASVAMEIALADGATEVSEREVYAAMGGQEVGFSVALRERLERLGIATSPSIGASFAPILDAERYDDRLLSFARHQRTTAGIARTLLPAVPDYDLRSVLRDLEEAHLRGALWCERRAAEFAASRELDFRPPDPAYAGGRRAASEVTPGEDGGVEAPAQGERAPRAPTGVGAGDADDTAQ